MLEEEKKAGKIKIYTYEYNERLNRLDDTAARRAIILLNYELFGTTNDDINLQRVRYFTSKRDINYLAVPTLQGTRHCIPSDNIAT